MVTVSRHVIRVENTVTGTTSNLEGLEVDLNGTMSNYFLLSLLVLTYFLHFPSPEYVNMVKRICRKFLYMYICVYIAIYIKAYIEHTHVVPVS